jgi:hypothetical protein
MYNESPYRVMAHDHSIPATSQDGLRGGVLGNPSNGPAFGANGEINASNKQELMQVIAQLLNQSSKKTVISRNASVEEKQMRVAELVTAYADKSNASGSKFQVLGEVISEEIWETLGRNGFSRQLFTVQPIAKGQTARVKVRKKDVRAWQVTEDTAIQSSEIRQDYEYPPSFTLAAGIKINDKEIEQASTDLLDEKFQDGLEAILVVEDRITRALMTAAATSFNDQILFTTFTPAVLTTMMTQVGRWALPPANLLIAYDIWQDIIADADFVRWWDQVH